MMVLTTGRFMIGRYMTEMTKERRNEIGYGLLKQVRKEIPSLLMNKHWVKNNVQALGTKEEEAQTFTEAFVSDTPPAKPKSEKSAPLDPKIQVSVPDPESFFPSRYRGREKDPCLMMRDPRR